MKNAGAVIWAVALFCAASAACAQGYLAKPIRIVVGNDIIARMVGMPASSVQELVAYAKANPGKLNYSSGSTAFQVASEMFI